MSNPRDPELIHPVSLEPCTAQELHDHALLQQAMREKNQGPWTCVHFSRQRKAMAKAFLQGADSITFSKHPTAGKQLFWAGKPLTHDLPADATSFFMEDGFIRSVGLGAKGVQPNSLVIDETGIYFDARRPSDLENILNYTTFSEEALQLADQLIQLSKEAAISKYNLTSAKAPLTLSHIHQKKILIPGQVPNDASILRGSLSFKTNLELLFTVRQENPDAYIIYKPHPDVVSGCRVDPIKPAHYQRHADSYIDNLSITDCYPVVDEVHTLTSLSGFEALQRGIKVYTYGMPFYAGWGLTQDRHYCPRRNRTLTLQELVAGALLYYPRYYDYDSQSFTTPYYLIRKLMKEKNHDNGR